MCMRSVGLAGLFFTFVSPFLSSLFSLLLFTICYKIVLFLFFHLPNTFLVIICLFKLQWLCYLSTILDEVDYSNDAYGFTVKREVLTLYQREHASPMYGDLHVDCGQSGN